MQIENIATKEIQEIQRTAGSTMTRVTLMETAVIGSASSVSVLVIEPLSLEITTGEQQKCKDCGCG